MAISRKEARRGPQQRAALGETRGVVVIEGSEDLGPIVDIPHVRNRDGARSGVVAKRMLWLFGDTFLDTGTAFTCSAALSKLDDPLHLYDERRNPCQFLPYTEEEIEFNRTHAPTRIALYPAYPLEIRPGVAVLSYVKLIAVPGSYQRVGEGLAWFNGGKLVAKREPDLLFSPQKNDIRGFQLFIRSRAPGDAEAYIYAYSFGNAAFGTAAQVARVLPKQVSDRTAYRFWNGQDWVSDNLEARGVVGLNASGFSVSWNDHLSQYIVVYTAAYNIPGPPDAVYIQCAPRPEGPWGPPVLAFISVAGTMMQPNGHPQPIYDAVDHPEVAAEGGRGLFITYHRNLGRLWGENRAQRVWLR